MKKLFQKKIMRVTACTFLVFLLVNCGSDDDSGACTVGQGITQGCGDMKEGECSLINGTFHSGVSCSDLGFVSSE